MKSGFNVPLFVGLWLSLCSVNVSAGSPVAYDMDMAREICDNLPLEEAEGIWMYPDDHVTVMILKDRSDISSGNFDTYTMSVVETTDALLRPGDVIGNLRATTGDKIFTIQLATEKKNELLLRPKTCIATLSSDGDALTFKRQKSPFKGRFNLNFNRLLPGFWKLISTGISTTGNASTVEAPVGMIKIYPGYDGNGSSRRRVRYL